MRGLKISKYYLPAATIPAVALFHALYACGRIPYPFINIFFLALAPLGYFCTLAASAAIVGLSWAALLPLFFAVYKVDAISAAAPLAVFSILTAAFAAYRKVADSEEGLWISRLQKEEAAKAASAAEFEKARRFESGIIEKELSLISIYEMTKKLSASLRFEEMFDMLGSFLKDNFEFGRCELIVLKWDGTSQRPDRIYSVSKKGSPGPSGSGPDREALTGMFVRGAKEISISKADAEAFGNLGLDRAGVDTFVAIPLLAGNRIVGILCITDIPKKDVEKFAIIAVQFALEIKKVLLYETVEELAITDGLTGLYVRRHFFERLKEELNRSKRHKFKLSFLMADIDDFKKCNDTYGHLVGDVVLKDIARIMKENLREIDLVARYGGEEFSIALPETGAEGAHLAAERIRKKIDEHVFKAYDEKLKVTISIGYAVFPDDAMEMKDLVERSDRALYEAKRSGKNIVYTYTK